MGVSKYFVTTPLRIFVYTLSCMFCGAIINAMVRCCGNIVKRVGILLTLIVILVFICRFTFKDAYLIQKNERDDIPVLMR